MWFLNSGAGVAVFGLVVVFVFRICKKIKIMLIGSVLLARVSISHVKCSSSIALLFVELACWCQRYQTQSKNCRASGCIHLVLYFIQV
jgi:hypothetical protein